jgi:hypothetical protein
LNGLKQLTFVVFDTGKVVLTGGRSESDLQSAYDQVCTYFEAYKLGSEAYDLPERFRRTRYSLPESSSSSTTARRRKKKQQEESPPSK